MATKTPNLGLIKPARGEFTGTWDIPMNANANVIDDAVGSTQTEVANARGSQGTLSARLAGSLNADGSLKDVPEVAAARNSSVYGSDVGGNAFTLKQRIEKNDRENFDSRMGLGLLKDTFAFTADDAAHNSVLSAPNGFLSFTGANAKVDGSVTSVICNINGYRNVVRTLKQTTISGAAGTYYIFLQRNSTGDLLLDRTAGGQNTGSTAIDTGSGKLAKFTDSTQNFITSGIQPGDILEITSVGSLNIGQYIVSSVVDANNLLIIGLFVSAQANLNYKLTNPLAPTLGFTATAHAKRFVEVATKIFIGRAVFDGTNITSITSYGLKGRFEQFVSISLTLGDFLQTVSHNLGYVPTRMRFYASQANDFSQSLEPLSVCDMTASTLQRSVIVKFDDLTVSVKNATNGIYYKSFDGTSQTSGFLFIQAER